jgi:hypothetical protein
MTKRLSVSPAPGPLEDYARSFDDLFGARAQREGFRRYLEGLLLPAERNKTLTALANTEPVVGAQRLPKRRACSGSFRNLGGTQRSSTSVGWSSCSKRAPPLRTRRAFW